MSNDLERVRSDLSLMSQWLGLQCPWGMADVRFGAVLSVAFGFHAACTWPASPVEIPKHWAAVPDLRRVRGVLRLYGGQIAPFAAARRVAPPRIQIGPDRHAVRRPAYRGV